MAKCSVIIRFIIDCLLIYGIMKNIMGFFSILYIKNKNVPIHFKKFKKKKNFFT